MLVFSAKIQSKPSILATSAEAGYVVEPFCIRPAVVVDDGLSKMKAVAQRRSCYTQWSGIGSLKQYIQLARPIKLLHIRFQLSLHVMENLAGFRIVVYISDLVRSLSEHIYDTQSSPRAHSEVGRIDIAKAVQAIHRRIDPIVNRHISRAQRANVLAMDNQHVLATSTLCETIGEGRTDRNKSA